MRTSQFTQCVNLNKGHSSILVAIINFFKILPDEPDWIDGVNELPCKVAFSDITFTNYINQLDFWDMDQIYKMIEIISADKQYQTVTKEEYYSERKRRDIMYQNWNR